MEVGRNNATVANELAVSETLVIQECIVVSSSKIHEKINIPGENISKCQSQLKVNIFIYCTLVEGVFDCTARQSRGDNHWFGVSAGRPTLLRSGGCQHLSLYILIANLF